ncbi:MAG: hypothetical protein ACK5V3_06565 [Bdellovibrionales bacterium]
MSKKVLLALRVHNDYSLTMVGAVSVLFFVTYFFIGTALSAQDTSSELSVMCRLSKQVRTLRIEKLKNGTCRTIYTKYGQDQSIGNAQNPQSCTEILQKVRGILEAADWQCRDIKEARLSNIVEPR